MSEAVPSPEPVRSRPHLPFLDGVRALAATYVIGAHSAGYVLDPPSEPFLGSFFAHGNLAVALFIVLSGYSLMLSVAMTGELKGGARGYYRRRYRRILPPYYAALALSAVLGRTLIAGETGTRWDLSLPITAHAAVSHLTLTHDLFPTDLFKINGPLWTVAVEAQIYLLFPLVVLAFARGRAGIAACLASGFVAVALLDLSGHGQGFFGTPLVFLSLFSFGCLAAFLSVRSAQRLRAWPLLALVLGLAAMSPAAWAYGRIFPTVPTEPASDAAFGLACAAFLLALGSGQWPVLRRALSVRPLLWVGTMAYSVYLLHAPVLEMVWRYGVVRLGLQGPARFAVLTAVAVPVIYAAARLFHVAVERPFLSKAVPADRKAAP